MGPGCSAALPAFGGVSLFDYSHSGGCVVASPFGCNLLMAWGSKRALSWVPKSSLISKALSILRECVEIASENLMGL